MHPLAVFMPLLFASLASADVLTVAQTGTGDFVELNDAIGAASAGDTIWVRGGSYERIDLVKGSLHITAIEDAEVIIAGVSVEGLGFGQTVTLTGLTIWNGQALPIDGGALTIRNCLGSVRVQDCTVAWNKPQAADGVHAIAISVIDSNDVAFTSCQAGGGVNPRYTTSVLLINSQVSMHDCWVYGSTNATGPGLGANVQNSTLIATGGRIQGGTGGEYLWWETPTRGGTGLLTRGPSTIFDVGCDIRGGDGGTCYGWSCYEPNGEQGPAMFIGAGGVYEAMDPPSRSWTCPNLSFDNRMLRLEWESQPGDELYVFRSGRGEFSIDPSHASVQLVNQPGVASPHVGTHGPAWSGMVEVPISDLGVDGQEGSFLLQSFIVTAGGDVVWLAPYALSILDDARLEALVGRVYVDASAADGGDGRSWASAYSDLQEALDAVTLSYQEDMPQPREVWVAQGTYIVPYSATPYDGFSAHFPGSLYGGFAGDETRLEERDLSAHVTILDGDRLGDDGPGFTNYEDNAKELLIMGWPGGAFSNVSLLIDGFTFRGAGSIGSSANSAVRLGGSHVRNCVFRDNQSMVTFRLEGVLAQPMLIEGCDFIGNTSIEAFGAAAYLRGYYSMVNCRFLENKHPTSEGGALTLWGQSYDRNRSVTNCFFRGNESLQGAAILYDASTDPPIRISNCTLVDNHGVIGAGGIRVEGDQWSNFEEMPIEIDNCVLWGNSNAGVFDEAAQLEFSNIGFALPPVHYSTLQGWTGGLGGLGNNGSDPLVGSDGSLGFGSPCIDSGWNEAVPGDLFDLDGDGDVTEPLPFDMAGNPRFVDDPLAPDTGSGVAPLVDRGALERQP